MRKRELDFLRGVAIILVLFRHKALFEFTQTMGWIGVDLFFVLSGFLVSGLLFQEYIKFGDINPKLFLIRRGFKIYPIFYLSLIPFLLFIFVSQKPFVLSFFISELLFVQNYVTGFGWALYGVSWSLAVEEHFYIAFSICLFYILKYKLIDFKSISVFKFGRFEKAIFTIMVICNVFRILHNVYDSENYERNFTMTHLRIDSLLAGVFVAYLYYFRLSSLKYFYHKNKMFLMFVPLILLSFTPFVEPLNSFFVKTIGFTMLYIAFGLVLVIFLLSPTINIWLDRILSKVLVDFISMAGLYSYSIYIVHTFVLVAVHKIYDKKYDENIYLSFAIYFFLSIFLGRLVSIKIESLFLRIRNKYYPSR